MKLTLRAVTVVLLALLAAPLAVDAQEHKAGKVHRIGVLATEPSGGTDALRQGLRERGYVEGRNIAIEWRWSRGRAERFPDLALELVRLKIDVIVATSNPAIAAAQKATSTIPVVMVYASDPVALGFVGSLARPGGNITGMTGLATELQGKRLQLLKEALPTVSRVAVLWDPTEPGRRAQVRETEVAALAVGVSLQLFEARSPTELDKAFGVMTTERVDAVLIGASSMIFAQRARIGAHAAKSRLPTMCLGAWYVEPGCLMSYGTDFVDLHRRAATYVDKILKGAKPADLPVEQPTRFEIVINVKTAEAIGLTIPPSLLLRANRLIE